MTLEIVVTNRLAEIAPIARNAPVLGNPEFL
jgi:hypothetical protein